MQLDWHNEASRPILDINNVLAGTADEQAKGSDYPAAAASA